jgi:hypothetical protein
MSRQTQRGRGFWRRGKRSSSPTHRKEQYTPFISGLHVVAQPGTAPTQGPHSLHNQAMSQTHTHTHTSTPLPYLKDRDSAQIGLFRRWSGSPFASQRQAYYLNQVLTSLTGGVTNWFPSLLQVPLCNQDKRSSVPGEVSPSVGSTGSLTPGGTLSWQAMDAESQWQGGENTISKSHMSPQKCCGIFKQGNWTQRLFWKQCLLACWQQLSRFTSKGWAPKTKRPCLIYPYKQVTEVRSKI